MLSNPPSAQAFLPDFASPLHFQLASLNSLQSPTHDIFERFTALPKMEEEADQMYVDPAERDEQSVGSAGHSLDVDMDVGKSMQIQSQSVSINILMSKSRCFNLPFRQDDPNPLGSPALDVEMQVSFLVCNPRTGNEYRKALALESRFSLHTASVPSPYSFFGSHRPFPCSRYATSLAKASIRFRPSATPRKVKRGLQTYFSPSTETTCSTKHSSPRSIRQSDM